MSMTSDAALSSTQAFIDDNPIDVELVRTPRIRSTAGGWVNGTPVTLEPQTMRLVAQNQHQGGSHISGEGDVEVVRYILVAMPDVEMSRGDTFVHNDLTYRIRSVSTSPPFAKRGECVEHAG